MQAPALDASSLYDALTISARKILERVRMTIRNCADNAILVPRPRCALVQFHAPSFASFGWVQPYEGQPESLASKLKSTQNVDQIFRRAQAAFNVWSKLPAEDRTPQAILSALDFDFFELLDSVTIARSRRHITTFYDTTGIGDFPTNVPSASIRSGELAQAIQLS
jgi:hypothetical protein